MMKKYFKRKVLTTYLFSLFFLTVYSQDDIPYKNEAFGPDSASRIECANDLSTLAEFMKIDLPEYALPAWRRVFKNCPESRKNIYISGAKIYQYLLDKESNEARKAGLFDTLMMIYDLRIQYFGDEGYVLGRKGIDIVRYKPEAYPDAYQAFNRSAGLSGTETDLNVITGLVQTASAVYRQGLIPTGELLEKYILSEEIYAGMIAERQSISKVKRAQDMTQKIIMNTGIRDCEGIEAFFRPGFGESGLKPSRIRIAIELLTLSGCENTSFFAECNEMLMKLEPDPSVAYVVAKYNLQNENFSKASEFLLQAIEYEKDVNLKAQYLQQLAVIQLSKLNNPAEARKNALKASELKPDWGEPYFTVASALIEGVKSCNVENFDKQAIYWLAVDYCARAMSVDPSCASRAADLINQYKNGYPSVEETFFRSLKDGDSYSFGCWINESTRVKSR